MSNGETFPRRSRDEERRIISEKDVLVESRTRVRLENEPQLRNGMVEVHLSDGNQFELQTRSFGPKDGWPIIVCHGTPGSSIGPHPRAIWLYTGGIRLIAWDRPGGGGSGRHKGRIVGDSATYVEAIAKAYGIKKCSVAGRSGGGSHALACASELPDLVVNAAVLAGIAPSDAEIEWHEGALATNAAAYRESDPDELDRQFAPVRDASKEYIYALLDSLAEEMSPSDARYLKRESVIKELIALSHADSLKDGSWQRVDDVIAAQKPWGFNVGGIDVPVTLLQGEDDPWTLLQHFRWLAKNIPTAHAAFLPNMGHIETLEITPTVYELLRDQAQYMLAA